MKQFQPCQSLEETLKNLGITEQHLDVGESVFPTYVGMQRQQILEATEHLKGGKGDGKQDVEFDPEELAMGIEIEKEHTNNALTAKEIAKDHLSEIPDYYTRLKDMEKQADVPAEEPKPEDTEQVQESVDNKPLHKKQHYNDINVIVVLMPDDEYSKEKQTASDLVVRKEAIELCNMDSDEIYGVFPHDEDREAMKIAEGLLKEVEEARAERAQDEENE